MARTAYALQTFLATKASETGKTWASGAIKAQIQAKGGVDGKNKS
jgi:hypothetical protein